MKFTWCRLNSSAAGVSIGQQGEKSSDERKMGARERGRSEEGRGKGVRKEEYRQRETEEGGHRGRVTGRLR